MTTQTTTEATCKFCGEGDGRVRGQVRSWTGLGAFHDSCDTAATAAAKAAAQAAIDAAAAAHTPRAGFRVLKAKYAGACIRCRGRLAAGQWVEWAAGAGAAHLTCPMRVTAPATATATATATAPAPKPAAFPARGTCRYYRSEQGCPLHGETCR